MAVIKIKFAKKYDVFVFHDNAYSELVFDEKKCGSFLAFEGAKDVGVEFNSLSKTYGMAGARVGFCLGNEEFIKVFNNYWPPYIHIYFFYRGFIAFILVI